MWDDPITAAGPETLTFEEILRLLGSAVGVRIRLAPSPTPVGLALTRLVGLLLRDVVLIREEVDGLIAELLTSATTPTGNTTLGDWVNKEGKAFSNSTHREIGHEC